MNSDAFILNYQAYARWERENRRGMRYYGRTSAERRRFKDEIKRRSAQLIPFLQAAQPSTINALSSVDYRGVAGPSDSCTYESFYAAANYEPTKDDIFVAAQMKCGTTWMQQIVYEVLSHGQGNLGDDGHGHICAVSPWMEAVDGVGLYEAPFIGRRRRRLLKTHLPAAVLPYSSEAKYICVTRHPVACFASVVDFLALLAGPYVPRREELLAWYCSDKMWWRSWPEHVAGFWDWSQQYSNVLFIHFEEMLHDINAAVSRVADFIGERLSNEETRRVVEKSNFSWMKEHEELFEMSPPNMFSVSGTFFKSGRADRSRDVSSEDHHRILAFCRERITTTAHADGCKRYLNGYI